MNESLRKKAYEKYDSQLKQNKHNFDILADLFGEFPLGKEFNGVEIVFFELEEESWHFAPRWANGVEIQTSLCFVKLGEFIEVTLTFVGFFGTCSFSEKFLYPRRIIIWTRQQTNLFFTAMLPVMVEAMEKPSPYQGIVPMSDEAKKTNFRSGVRYTTALGDIDWTVWTAGVGTWSISKYDYAIGYLSISPKHKVMFTVSKTQGDFWVCSFELLDKDGNTAGYPENPFFQESKIVKGEFLHAVIKQISDSVE